MRIIGLICAASIFSAGALLAIPGKAQQRLRPGEVTTDGGCMTGLLWREAFPGDHLCVSHAAREIIALDNLNDISRHKLGFRGVVLAECIPGYVWREARSGDTICVTPAERAQVAHDNAVAAARVSGPVPNMPVADRAPASAYQTSPWSAWMTKDGVQYRYRWGWDPTVPGFSKSIDALFEINNQTAMPWKGNARGWSCANTLGPSRDVSLSPGQHVTVSFKTDNCGTLVAPFFKGSVVRSSTF
jgi:hypothetical protein